MQRVTFDTNVLISALTHQGAAARLLTLAGEGSFRLQLSQPILNETAEVLERDFQWPLKSIEEIRILLSCMSQRVTPHVELDIVKRDPDDNRILECSLASRSDYLVTSDKDLLDLKQYGGASIIKPIEFLALLSERGR